MNIAANWIGTIQIGHTLDQLDSKYADPESIEDAGARYLMGLEFKNDSIQYACWQVERGNGSDTGSGRVHVQAYVELKRGRSLEWLKRNVHDGHWEKRRGSQEQAIAYCTKDDTRIEGGGPKTIGTPKAQGARNDLVKVKDMLVERRPITEILEECPGSTIRYIGNIQKVKSLLDKDRTEWPAVTWYCGPTGTGKTTRVLNYHGQDRVYVKNCANKWWCGYDQNIHHAVLLDEFDWSKDWCNLSFMLQLFNKTKLMVETKGGQVKFNSPFIYLTTNYHPDSLPSTWRTPAMTSRFIVVECLVVKRELDTRGTSPDDRIDIDD